MLDQAFHQVTTKTQRLSFGNHAAVDDNARAAHKVASLACQEDDGATQIIGFAPPTRWASAEDILVEALVFWVRLVLRCQGRLEIACRM